MAPELCSLAPDAQFWPAAAQAVCDFALRQGAEPRQLQTVTWLVPSGTHAGLARLALRAAIGKRAFIPPRIVTLADWLGRPLQAGTSAHIEYFSALRANAWVRESFGAQPATLWALARGVSELADELTWAAADDPDALDSRLQASLVRHYRRRAARALEPQAQLVLQLWRARRSADEGPAQALRELGTRADEATAPLVYTASNSSFLGQTGILKPWEDAFLQRYARRAPVLLLAPGLETVLSRRPLLAAAWPELAGTGADVAIVKRADALHTSGVEISAPLSIVSSGTLEEEASAVSRQVLDWLREGLSSIALVALDRLTARRVRALLERARVRVRDENGWKLSTTSAAAVVMRWYDMVADDLYWRDLLDWLKSSFTLANRPRKAREIAALERAIRAAGTLQGARAMTGALDDLSTGEEPDAVAGAREVLRLIGSQVQAASRAGPALAAHARALHGALESLGMRAGLAADPVGAAVLRELDALKADLSEVTGRATLADFRALLAERFEDVSHIDRQVESPVVLVSLAATYLRSFDAVLLIGADARHLPAAPAELLFMSNAVRAELGLATADDSMRAQTVQLAALLASTPRVVATWRTHEGAEPNIISPLLERLQFVAQRAFGDELAHPAAVESFEVVGIASVRPAPNAEQLLPERLSASQAQSLVDCAYQFYARRLLGLVELEDVIEFPDKRDFGEAMHEVLRRFHRDWGGFDFSAADHVQLATNLRAVAQGVFIPRLQRMPGLLAFQRRFDRLIDGYIAWLQEHAAKGWRWRAGEEKHQSRLVLRDGREIELTGRLDRIDAQASEPDDGRVLVLDYKARSADVLRRGLVEAGEDIQLPFYGILLADRAASAAYLSFDRAKDDESGVTPVVPPQVFTELVASVADRLGADLQRIAEGAALPAIGAKSVCEYCEMRGLCRRDYWEDDTEHPLQGDRDGRVA
jgi:ATP-dependent helicase/nuclease subunit B